MTRVQRRSKSQWINRLKKQGYAYFNGQVWQKRIWTMTTTIFFYTDHDTEEIEGEPENDHA